MTPDRARTGNGVTTNRYRTRRKQADLRRVITHVHLGAMVSTLYLLVTYFVPRGKQFEFLTVAFGYFSLLLICVTLLIGPLTLLRWRRNPVNLNLRRDIGIWAAITGGLHVLLVFRGTLLNGQILFYFLRAGCCGYEPLLNVYGISNDLGLFATLLLFLLLALSNNISLRLLKGKWWKRLQRLTYLLALLAVGHTFGYQYLNIRGAFLLVMVIVLIIFVLICQGLGIVLTMLR